MMDLAPQEIEAVDALAPRFCPDCRASKLLHRGEGLVVELARAGPPAILKIIPSATEIAHVLRARLGWITHLHQNGLRVPELIASTGGGLVEAVELRGIIYTAYAYISMPITARNQIDWRDATMPPRLGNVMGRMHRLARSYRPGPGKPTIGHWHDADWLREPERVLHRSQSAIADSIYQLRDRISQFPRDQANYGLIHDDLHTGNVFCLDGDLVIIDFDCCHHSWYAGDISSAVLFRVWIGPHKDAQEATAFLQGLIQGYTAQNDLPLEWASMLPYFLKLREISLFQSFYRDMDASRMEGDAFFQYLFDSISMDKPFFDVDFIH